MKTDTLTGYGKTWPLLRTRETVNGLLVDALRLSAEDAHEHARLQDEAARRDLFGLGHNEEEKVA